jgi:hypothetical protein
MKKKNLSHVTNANSSPLLVIMGNKNNLTKQEDNKITMRLLVILFNLFYSCNFILFLAQI